MAKDAIYIMGLGLVLLLLAGAIYALMPAGNSTYKDATTGETKTVPIMKVRAQGDVAFTGASSLLSLTQPFQFNIQNTQIATLGPATNTFPFSIGTQSLFETDRITVTVLAFHKQSGKEYSSVISLDTLSTVTGGTKHFSTDLNLPAGSYVFTFIAKEGAQEKARQTLPFEVNA